MKIIRYLIATSLLASFLGACETPQDQAIESARACDNSAAQVSTTNPTLGASMATNCIAILQNANVTTAEAEKVMFGAILIEDQIINNIAQAASDLKANPNNSAGLNSMLPLLLPTPISPSTQEAEATKLENTANATGDAGSVYIASLVGMAVIVEDLSGNLSSSSPGTTQTDLTNCANTGGSGTISSGPYAGQQCSSLVGPLFTSLASSACASPYDQTSTSPTDMCYQAKQVINAADQAAGNSNPTNAQITAALAAYLATVP